jgi:hypothetical protein
MSFHWVYVMGSKACVWSGALAAPIWPQSPCDAEEAWNMGWIIVGAFALASFVSLLRRVHAWHSFYSR